MVFLFPTRIAAIPFENNFSHQRACFSGFLRFDQIFPAF